MPRRDEVTRKGTIEALHKHFDAPALIHASSPFLTAATCSGSVK